jgi:hypothetical protein
MMEEHMPTPTQEEMHIDEMIARSLEIEYTEEELAEMEREYSRNIGYDSGFGE